jgi:23S rRNA pseudouridine1911/1915/1917 synthase
MPPGSLNQGCQYRDRITAPSPSVVDYYTDRYPHSSRAEWQQRLLGGQISLNQLTITTDQPLQAGQRLTYSRPPWLEPAVPLQFEILHDDGEILVINKPSGLPVLPGGGFLAHTLLGQLEQRYPEMTPYPVHRLGRGTSGLLLLAKTRSARAVLSQQLVDRNMHKVYRALVCGHPKQQEFGVEVPIGKIPYPVLGYLHAATPDGLPSHSMGRVVECRQDNGLDSTLMDVTILTGRPHQIRIHMAAAGHPLVGDPLYGVGGVPMVIPEGADHVPVPGDCGYHLHAMHLRFTHPNGELMALICEPPAMLQSNLGRHIGVAQW